MGMNWCTDWLFDVQMDLNEVQRLWDRQCFKQADARTTEEIKKRLKKAEHKLSEIVELIEEWGT